MQELVKQAKQLNESTDNEFKLKKKISKSDMKSQQEDSIKKRI